LAPPLAANRPPAVRTAKGIRRSLGIHYLWACFDGIHAVL
jgi:hypothetical protein